MQPRDSIDTAVGVLSKEDKVKAIIEDILDKLPEEFNIQDLMSKVNCSTIIKYSDIAVISIIYILKWLNFKAKSNSYKVMNNYIFKLSQHYKKNYNYRFYIIGIYRGVIFNSVAIISYVYSLCDNGCFIFMPLTWFIAILDARILIPSPLSL